MTSEDCFEEASIRLQLNIKPSDKAVQLNSVLAKLNLEL